MQINNENCTLDRPLSFLEMLRIVTVLLFHILRCDKIIWICKSSSNRSVGVVVNAGVGKLFTRRARFGKTVEAADRTLIGKQGEDLFFFLKITVHVRM